MKKLLIVLLLAPMLSACDPVTAVATTTVVTTSTSTGAVITSAVVGTAFGAWAYAKIEDVFE